MGPVVQHTGEMPNAPHEIRIYPGADGEFTIYEDEGDSYRYETGLFSTINIQWNDNSSQLIFGKRKGEFPGMADYRDFNIVIVRIGFGVGIEESKQPDLTIRYNGEKLTVSI
jgi:alpha-D-xyloside xylohydrolase